jgi:hypothetical protein
VSLVRAITRCLFGALLLSRSLAFAQTIDDGVMIPARTLFAGYLYTHDAWDHYWEGPLKRTNGNIGTLTSQTGNIYVDYGILDRLDVIAEIPFVWNQSSQGVLASQAGWQDITLAAKYRLIRHRLPYLGAFTAFAVPFWSGPLSNYSPDFQPLSIGLHSRRAGIRATVHFQYNRGWYLNASASHAWQSEVDLDRPYYFTNNHLFLTNVVEMPRVIDYSISPGYMKKNRMFQFTFSRLITQGGADVGDIRRQDLPFVANRLIATRIGGAAMYPVPFVPSLAFRFEYSHVIDGRNVGQSNTYTLGLLKTQYLGKRK